MHSVKSHTRTNRLACFFFQADDGIRDGHVTGVQTCALPISRCSGSNAGFGSRLSWSSSAMRCSRRSEERRVGKECRARGSPNPLKKKERRGAAASRRVRRRGGRGGGRVGGRRR